ncbi:MAG: ABC transporter substrate-binding protein [Dehalococcoidia bacterium]|nr:ABC transporter substrate-binding protein [Dehalococcoidia bacterium]
MTAAQVADSIAKALSDRPGITEAQVADAIAGAIADRPGVTEDQMASAIANALTQQTPGLTEAEVAAAITRALEDRPGISQEDIQMAVEMAVEEAMTPEPFRIGVMDSLTGVGESYGNPIVNAKQLAVDEINAMGGINGRMLELIIEDSKCNAQDAITAYRKLTDVDGVRIILGTTCSGAMLGAAPLAEEDRVILLSPSATNPDISVAGDYIFRTAISDAQLGADAGNAMWVDGIRNLVTITETTDYAEGVRRTSVEQFQKLGGKVIGEERYSSDSTDFRTQLTKLIGLEPDGILLAAQGELPGGTIIKQARELGYDGPIYTESVPTGATALEIAGDAATGVKSIIPADLDPNNRTAQDMLANFRETYGYLTLAWFLGSAYDTVYIAAECLGRTGNDQDSSGFRNCMNDISHSGTIGVDYSFDANGDVVGLSYAVVEILPVAERNDDNLGYKPLGPAPSTSMAMAAMDDGMMMMDDKPFRIGVMESVTGPGETYGNVAVQAKQMAAAEINAAGGINGRMLELIVEDEKCNAQDSITAYRKLTDVDGVKIILGTSCSGAMLGAAPLAEEDGVVMFSGLATNPDIAEAGDYIFRTSLNDAQVGIDTGNLLWEDGVRKLATISESTDYAEGVRRTTAEHFMKLGGEIVGEERYASDVIDFRSQLTKLINAAPDAIHIAAQSEFTGGTVVKQIRELGYEGSLYSEIVPVGTTALEIAGEAATGLKAVTAELDPANQAAQNVLARFRATYGYVTLPWYLGSAYDDVYITAECLKQTGDDQDADGFKDCMYGITWTGTIGENYSFDERGEVVGLANAVVEVLPLAERTDANQGYKVLGPAPSMMMGN